MKQSIWRGALVVAAVGALTIGLVPAASADQVDSDPSFTVDISNATTYRIAGNTRIQTAIKASQSRDDWGRFGTNRVWECEAPSLYDGVGTNLPEGSRVQFWDPTLGPDGGFVFCTVVVDSVRRIDIIVARDDDFSDALAAAPLADVLDAPILINPSDALNSDVAAEIERLAGGADFAVVHLLGGTNALSAGVENAINALPSVNFSWRYQGVNRYETAVNIAEVTVNVYGLDSGADFEDINVYLTTGLKFPDALAAGAAAAENDGVVLLTKGDEFDSNPSGFSYTYDALVNLDDWIPSFDENTSEIFAVGGPSYEAAVNNDVRLADSFVGADRYETATLTAEGTFDRGFADLTYFAVASGENYPDAVVAAGYIANADGPLLLTRNTFLSPSTKDYLQANADLNDVVFVFGGTNSVNLAVQAEIDAAVTF